MMHRRPTSRATARLIFAVTSLALAAAPALAQTAIISIDDALRIARGGGIAIVTKIELDDRKWEAEGRNSAGQKLEIDIDAATGGVLKTETK